MEWRSAGWLVRLPLLVFPCTIKSRSSLTGAGSPGWSGKKGRKTVVCVSMLRTSADLWNDVSGTNGYFKEAPVRYFCCNG